MQRRLKLHRWLLTAWCLLWGCMLTFAFGQRYGSPYRGASSGYMVISDVSNSAAPAYEFHSTSACSSVVGSSLYAPTVSEPFASASGKPNGARRSFGDPEAEGYGVGEIPNPAPVGSPLVLLLMAVLYIFYTNRKKIYEKFAQFKKM